MTCHIVLLLIFRANFQWVYTFFLMVICCCDVKKAVEMWYSPPRHGGHHHGCNKGFSLSFTTPKLYLNTSQRKAFQDCTNIFTTVGPQKLVKHWIEWCVFWQFFSCNKAPQGFFWWKGGDYFHLWDYILQHHILCSGLPIFVLRSISKLALSSWKNEKGDKKYSMHVTAQMTDKLILFCFFFHSMSQICNWNWSLLI